MSQYEYLITYINGEQNTVADTLSLLPNTVDDEPNHITAAAVFSISSNQKLVRHIQHGYKADPWCSGIMDDMKKNMINAKLNISMWHGLLFIRNHLIIPKYKNLWEHLFTLAHNNLGHFGSEKSYASLWEDFYWPNMQKNLTQGYVPGCPDCQQNKSVTSKTPRPLHLLPVPIGHFDLVVIDFMGPLPKDDGFDTIMMMTDHLGTNVQIIACCTSMTAEELAYLFFDRWYCEKT